MTETLQQIYADLPTIDCQRKCQAFCGPLLIPRVEYVNIEKSGALFNLSPISMTELSDEWSWMPKKKLVSTLPRDGTLDCAMLYPNGKCRVYAVRPLICRIWGMIDNPTLRCPYGCKPTRWLTNKEVRSLMERILAVQ